MEAGAQIEIWHPNREKPESRQMQSVVIGLLVASAVLALIVAVGGWERLEGGGAICIAYVALYLLFAYLVSRWNRGTLPVASALAVILAIFGLVAGPAWFERDKAGFDSPMLDENLLGMLTLILVPLQIALIAMAMRAFGQEWHVEEERPLRR